MTATAPPPLVPDPDAAVEPDSRRRLPGSATGRWSPLLILAAISTIPAALPIAFLVWSVVRPGGIDAGGVSTGRLIELALSTGWLVATVTVATTVLGFTTAWLTTRTDLAGRRVWSTLVSLPLVIPSYVGALSLLAATGNQGLIARLLEAVGVDGGPGLFTGFGAAWLALTLWNFPFVHLLAVPALRRLDPALEESARSLGSSTFKVIRTVVLPQLRATLTSASLLVSLYVISDFGAVSLLRYETFTLAIYTQLRGRLDVTPALFLSGILVLGGLAVVFIERRVRGRAFVAMASKPGRRQQPAALSSSGRATATVFLAVVVLAALVVPLATLLYWALVGTGLGNSVAASFGALWTETGRSLSAAAIAAVVAALAALPVAIVSVRRPSLMSKALETTAWATYSLPHLAVGLGFLVIALRFVPGLYQRLPLLVIAYVAMFLPQAVTAAQSGLRQVAGHLEDASRSLGVGSLGTFRQVTFPLVAPSVLAGGALVFLTVMKELPATLLLRPTGFDTLAIRIWSASSELFYTQASAAALILIGVSALPLYLLVIRDIHER